VIDLSLRADPAVLRPWRPTDRGALVRCADDREIWRNMTDAFPHPYTLRDAVEWIARVEHQVPPRHFAVLVDGALVGGAGVEPMPEFGGRCANLGYWLGSREWGRGIATAVVEALVPYAFGTLGVARLQATVFGWNPASARVLEKNGFLREGRLRNAVSKNGEVTDLLVYGLLLEDRS
jgi:RimJ/RimL family protein N-acetyltransferase